MKQASTLAAMALICTATQAIAHEGHDHGPGAPGGDVITTGPIAITAEAKTNLALRVEEAELRTLEDRKSVV